MTVESGARYLKNLRFLNFHTIVLALKNLPSLTTTLFSPHIYVHSRGGDCSNGSVHKSAPRGLIFLALLVDILVTSCVHFITSCVQSGYFCISLPSVFPFLAFPIPSFPSIFHTFSILPNVCLSFNQLPPTFPGFTDFHQFLLVSLIFTNFHLRLSWCNVPQLSQSVQVSIFSTLLSKKLYCLLSPQSTKSSVI